jgi:hypothetical protein
METTTYEQFGNIQTGLQVPDTFRTGNPRFYEVLGFVAYFWYTCRLKKHTNSGARVASNESYLLAVQGM